MSATKGLEAGSMLRMSQVVGQEAGPGHPVVVLSGPSFALEVAQQLPTAVLAASGQRRRPSSWSSRSFGVPTSGSMAATT